MKFGLILILVLTSTTFSCCYGIQVEAKTGEDVPLECVSVSGNISVLQWTRPDLADDKYVFLYRDNKVNERVIDPRFKDRVTWKGPKTADIILHDVTVNDTGTYQCQVVVEGNPRQKGAVNLIVTDGPPKWPFVVLGLLLLLAAAVAGVFGYKYFRLRSRGIPVVKAKPGEDVTLKGVSVSGDFTRLKWIREDIHYKNKSVFFYRNNKNEEFIDERFKDRVTWKDSKTADIILKDVTVNDTGLYECRVYGENQYQNGYVNLIVKADTQEVKVEEEVKAKPGEDVPLKGDSV